MMIWFIILLVNGIHGLPDGAPKSACSSLLPLHAGLTAQKTAAPYEIHAELSGHKVTVHMSSPSGEKFEGFILQARSSKDPGKFIHGEFTISQKSKAINCFDGNQNTLTHVNRDPKTELMTEWTPKENLNEEIVFRATVAKQFDIFWTKVDSNPVNLINNSSINNENMDLSYENCFKVKGCVGLPNGCIEHKNCEVLLKYSKSSNSIDFSLEGHLESSHYMAMGLSEDPIMGEDSVTECIRGETNVIARKSWNEGKSNTRSRELSREDYTSSFSDGLTSCSWTSPLVTVSNIQTYDFENEAFHILLAKGEVSPEGILKYHNSRMSSVEALNLTEIKSTGEVPNYNVEDDDHEIGGQHPSTTPRHEIGSTGKGKDVDGNKGITKTMLNTTDYTSRSSYIGSSYLFFLIGLFYIMKEKIL